MVIQKPREVSDLDINATEPAVFTDTYTSKPAVLRGRCLLKIKECLMIKRLSVKFNGVSQIQWPCGEKLMITAYVMKIVFPSFIDQNAGIPNTTTVANCTLTLFDSDTWETGALSHVGHKFSESQNANHRLIRTHNQKSRLRKAFSNKLCQKIRHTVESEYIALFPGTYTYNFEMVLPSQLPESVDARRVRVHYDIQTHMECPGVLGCNITHKKPVTVARCPTDDFLEDSEPLHVFRVWRHLLQCDISISRRGSPLCHQLPATVSLTGSDKTSLQGLQISVSEKTVLSQKNGSKSCIGLLKQALLYKEAEDFMPTVSSYKLGDHDQSAKVKGRNATDSTARSDWAGEVAGFAGMTMDIDIPLPSCQGHSEADWMHFDIMYKNIQVKHWLEV